MWPSTPWLLSSTLLLPSHCVFQGDPALTSPKLSHSVLCPCIRELSSLLQDLQCLTPSLVYKAEALGPTLMAQGIYKACVTVIATFFSPLEGVVKYIHANVYIWQLCQVLKLDHNFPKESEGPLWKDINKNLQSWVFHPNDDLFPKLTQLINVCTCLCVSLHACHRDRK